MEQGPSLKGDSRSVNREIHLFL